MTTQAGDGPGQQAWEMPKIPFPFELPSKDDPKGTITPSTADGSSGTATPSTAGSITSEDERMAELKLCLANGGPSVDMNVSDPVKQAVTKLQQIADACKRTVDDMHTRQKLPNVDDKIAEAMKTLNESVKTGVLPLSSPWGQKFKRDKTTGAGSDKYKQLTTHKEKELFRADWAKVELGKLDTKYSESTSERVETASLGRYLPFSRIWEEEGKDQEGYEASL